MGIKHRADSGFRKFRSLSKLGFGRTVKCFEMPYVSYPSRYMAFKKNRMKKTKLTILCILLVQTIFGQNKIDYLSENRTDLRKDSPKITETDFNIIGFGALHGSSKTYDAEFSLVSSLV